LGRGVGGIGFLPVFGDIQSLFSRSGVARIPTVIFNKP